jgi:hypothetical protein
MSMSKGEAIEVTAVANGYMVRPSPRSPGEYSTESKVFVFNHIEHLYEWIQDHFNDNVEQMEQFR